jgi:hypothetical protein
VVSYRVMLDVPRELVLFVSGLLAARLCVPKTCAAWPDALRDGASAITRTVPEGQV